MIGRGKDGGSSVDRCFFFLFDMFMSVCTQPIHLSSSPYLGRRDVLKSFVIKKPLPLFKGRGWGWVASLGSLFCLLCLLAYNEGSIISVFAMPSPTPSFVRSRISASTMPLSRPNLRRASCFIASASCLFPFAGG